MPRGFKPFTLGQQEALADHGNWRGLLSFFAASTQGKHAVHAKRAAALSHTFICASPDCGHQFERQLYTLALSTR
jgi:hypothetical protein